MTNVNALIKALTAKYPYRDQSRIQAYATLLIAKKGVVTAEDTYAAERVYSAVASSDDGYGEFADLGRYDLKVYERTANEIMTVFSNSTGADTAKLREILNVIWNNKKQWDQGSWCHIPDFEVNTASGNLNLEPPCGTSFCYAGWDAYLYAPEGSKISSNERVITLDGNDMSIMNFARDDLRLDETQAEVLFSGSNSFEDLEDIVGLFEKNPSLTGQALYKAAKAAAKRRGETAKASAERWGGYIVSE